MFASLEREFAPAGVKLFLAFTAGVVINLILGFVLSVLIFGHYLATLNHFWRGGCDE
jgi:hypothetical protein